MADIAELLVMLKSQASIETSEGFSDDDDLTPDLEEAVFRHNPFYTVTSLPAEEVTLVLILAWSKVCLRRASRFANLPDTTGGQGFASDRTTPYRKNIDLSNLLEARYRAMCDNMGVSGATSIVQGRITNKNALTDRMVPLSASKAPSVRLAMAAGESATVGTELILEWTTKEYSNFGEFYLYHAEDAVIIQKWNVYSATGVPCILDSAVRIMSSTKASQRSVRVTGLDKTKVNHFVLVNRSASEQYSYSNELTVGGP